jgi:hypothetical protein
VNEPFNPISAAIWALAVGLGMKMFVQQREGEPVSQAQTATFAAAGLAAIAYDRHYDGMWPFESESASGRIQYNPG